MGTCTSTVPTVCNSGLLNLLASHCVKSKVIVQLSTRHPEESVPTHGRSCSFGPHNQERACLADLPECDSCPLQVRQIKEAFLVTRMSQLVCAGVLLAWAPC